jgi:hypothetical protein
MFCCSWVNEQSLSELWVDGMEDYLAYAKELIDEYKDVLDSAGTVPAGSQTAIAPPAAAAAPPLFGASAGSNGGLFAFSAAPPASGGGVPFGTAPPAFPAAPAGGFAGFNFTANVGGTFGRVGWGVGGSQMVIALPLQIGKHACKASAHGRMAIVEANEQI